MKKIIAVSCILYMCCFLVKADVKEVEKFSKDVDTFCSFADAFLEYMAKIRRTFSKVENFKIITESPRNSIKYKGATFKTQSDFERFYKYLKSIESEGNLTMQEAAMLTLFSKELKFTANSIIRKMKYLAAVSGNLKGEYPNYSKRKAASNKLKNILKKFLKTGGVTLSQKKTKELMASF